MFQTTFATQCHPQRKTEQKHGFIASICHYSFCRLRLALAFAFNPLTRAIKGPASAR
jgi:hypothetical protein